MKNLNEMTVKELKEMAKEMKISNWWNLKKDVLIEKIEEQQNMTDEEKAVEDAKKAEENAAVAEYSKNWRKYTKTYNVGEFLAKWKSGEIVLEDEEEIEEVETEETVEEEKPVEETTEEETTENDEETEEVEKPTPKRGALLEFDGKSQNICAWGKELGISPNTLYGRIYKMNWSIEKAFTTPARKSSK